MVQHLQSRKFQYKSQIKEALSDFLGTLKTNVEFCSLLTASATIK